MIQRGFDPDLVICMVGHLDRLLLLPYKEKFNFFTTDILFLKMPFNFNILNLNDILSSSFNKIFLSNLLSLLKLRVLNFKEFYQN